MQKRQTATIEVNLEEGRASVNKLSRRSVRQDREKSTALLFCNMMSLHYLQRMKGLRFLY